jgi:pimeloyl-ACP methyl ester carboxylesterase
MINLSKAIRKQLTFMVVALALSTNPSVTLATQQDLLNFEAPTFGGKQVWQDTFVYAGWRIQSNILTGHSRLLDPDDIRMAWGNDDHCKNEFDRLRKDLSIRPVSKHMVLMVHGIARSTGTFSKMKQELQVAGYDAVAISYPSTRRSIEDHALALKHLLTRLEGTEMVSFVTHSMGGIVLRHVLAGDQAWRQSVLLGSVIMIAPPNQGSAVARVLKDVPYYKTIYGTPGQQLVPDAVTDMPVPLDVEMTIIAGGNKDGEGFNPFLDGDDDGTVKVSETVLDGTNQLFIVSDIHGTISNHPDTIDATLNVLKVGKLATSANVSTNTARINND